MTNEMASHDKVMNAWTALLMSGHILEKINDLEQYGIFENWSAKMDKSEVTIADIGIENIKAMAHNLCILALGGCFIATDEALVHEFGKFKKRQHTNNMSNLDSLRAIIFQARNAFAHTPTSPKWWFRYLDYARAYHIKDSEFNLELAIDLTGLNHKQFEIDHLGGWTGFNRLITYAMKLLQKKDGREFKGFSLKNGKASEQPNPKKKVSQ